MNTMLSAQMHAAAETLAAQVEEGDFGALTIEQRFGLRCLAMSIEGWSDWAATMEGELSKLRRPSLVRRVMRRVFA